MRLVDSFQKKPLESFIGKSVKYVIATAVTAVLLTSASDAPLYYATISVVNSAFGKLLKKVIRQPRPADARKSSYGMPSTHTLAAVYFCLVVIGKLDTVVSHAPLRYAIYVISVAYTALACKWRVSGGLHTVSQVAVGAVIGSAGALLALAYEQRFFAYLQVSVMPLLPPWVLNAVRLGLAVTALPVVFKKEVVWLLHPKPAASTSKSKANKHKQQQHQQQNHVHEHEQPIVAAGEEEQVTGPSSPSR